MCTNEIEKWKAHFKSTFTTITRSNAKFSNDARFPFTWMPSMIVCLTRSLRHVETEFCVVRTLYASFPWFCVQLDFYALTWPCPLVTLSGPGNSIAECCTWIHFLVVGHPVSIDYCLKALGELVCPVESGRLLPGSHTIQDRWYSGTTALLKETCSRQHPRDDKSHAQWWVGWFANQASRAYN